MVLPGLAFSSAAYLGGSAPDEVHLEVSMSYGAVVPLAGPLLVEGTPVSVTVDLHRLRIARPGKRFPPGFESRF